MESKSKSSCSCISLGCVLKVLTFLQLLRELFMATKEFYPGLNALSNTAPPERSTDQIQSFVLIWSVWLGNFLTVLALLDSINPAKGRVREFGIFLWVFAYFTLIPISNFISTTYYVYGKRIECEIFDHWEPAILCLPQVPILFLGTIHYVRCKSELSRWDNEAAMRNGENLPLIRMKR